jgi:hypothetical protein
MFNNEDLRTWQPSYLALLAPSSAMAKRSLLSPASQPVARSLSLCRPPLRLCQREQDRDVVSARVRASNVAMRSNETNRWLEGLSEATNYHGLRIVGVVTKEAVNISGPG